MSKPFSDMSAEDLVKSQRAWQYQMNSSITNFKKKGQAMTIKYAETKLVSIKDCWKHIFENHHQLLIAAMDNDPDAKAYIQNEIYEENEELFHSAQTLMQETIDGLRPTALAIDVHSSTLNTSVTQLNPEHIRLPSIPLPKFSGDYTDWTSYRDQFQSMIYNNERLTGVQKLHYLKSSLTGEAESLLRHVQITDANFLPAWKTLNERYENKRALINAQLKILLSQFSIHSESANGIKKLLDTTNDCMQQLTNLGIKLETWDCILIYITTQKLPIESHQLWEQSCQDCSDLPKMADLTKFLAARFRVLEITGNIKQKQPLTANTTKDKQLNFRKHTQSFHATNKENCFICNGDHRINKCPKFAEWSHESKLETIKKLGLCINCLGHGHTSTRCPSSRSCWTCKKRHHTILHKQSNEEPSKPSIKTITTGTMIPNPNQIAAVADIHPAPLNNYHVQNHQQQRILLATAMVTVSAENGLQLTARALLDQGSEACFVTEAIVQKLKIKRNKSSIKVIGLGESSTGTTKGKVHLNIQSKFDGSDIEFDAFVLPKLTNILPSNEIPYQKWQHLIDLELADPLYYQPSKIDLLIGADVYARIIQPGLRKGMPGTPVAQKTDLGWILSGTTINNQHQTNISNDRRSLISLHNAIDLDQQLKRFWELEEVDGTSRLLTKDERMCEQYYEKTVARDENGRFIVRLPFSQNKTENFHGKSRDLAITQLTQLERRFSKNPKLHEEYSNILNDYLLSGHMKPVSSTESENIVIRNKEVCYKVNYLPHHAVFKESTSTRVRVVFNASQKTSNGKSLNDELLTGPTIQEDLISIITRWRKYRYAFTADIQKMYRQIQVSTEDIEHQRIVWRNNQQDVIQDYNLTTVTFGTTSAPYLAIKTIQWLAQQNRDQFPIAAEAIKNDFYVDDILSGADTITEVCEKQHQLLKVLSSGCFQLRKWSSNCQELLYNLQADYIEMNLPVNLDRDYGIKTLGIIWYPLNDKFTYKIKIEPSSNNLTKRSILSEIAKLYDPLGWITPTIILAKLLIQQLWLSGVDWDEQVPKSIGNVWLEYRQQLKHLETIQIPRWLHTTNKNVPIQIHGFCDASQQAYAATIYIRCIDENNKVHVQLLIAKSRVAPLKSISLPRLELNGALLLAKLLKRSVTALKLIKFEIFAWSDSTIVLAWLQGHPNKWTTFVANRVAKIQELTQPEIWNHVATKDNPADCATRGVMPSDLSEHPLWWTGPRWLHYAKDQWPTKKIKHSTDAEVKHISTLTVFLEPNNLDEMLLKYSRLETLINVTAYCLRFYHNCKTKTKSDQLWLTNDERKKARELWINFTQVSQFSKEIRACNQGKDIPSNSRIKNLNPFIDNNGLLRVGGRLKHSTLNFNEKHPIILPNKHHFTNLIIQATHTRSFHGGPQLMMTLLQKQYWILDCRNNIRHLIYKCIPCFRQRAQTAKQLMGNLPKERISIARPFFNTGIDYAGPIDLKVSKGRSPKTTKAHIAIFVCLAVKAIHLELVSDLTTDAFLAAFRRFVARRGSVANVFSDNGTNFVGANNELNKQLQQFISSTTPEIATILAKQNIAWHFIPPASPHFGGLWEAGVKSMKTHLKRTVGNTKLTYEEMSTVLTQIEGCLNSRPLCPITNDINDCTALTPGHFLIGDALLAPAEPLLINEKQHRLNRWQYLQQIQQHYWTRWSTEYLRRLQQRPKWLQQNDKMEIGSLVLIKNERVPPTNWLLARVVEKFKGTDGLTRVVKLKTKDNFLTRSVTKVCLLPLDDTANHLKLN